MVLTGERYSLNQDLNDENLINAGVIIRPRGLEKNHKSIKVGRRLLGT